MLVRHRFQRSHLHLYLAQRDYSGIHSDSVKDGWELGFKVQGSRFRVQGVLNLHIAIGSSLRATTPLQQRKFQAVLDSAHPNQGRSQSQIGLQW